HECHLDPPCAGRDDFGGAERAFARLARRMRALLVTLVLLAAAAAVLAGTSGADTPARARAQATVVSGSLGDFGTLEARGDDDASDDSVTVDASGVKIGAAKTAVHASRGRGASARASSLARHIDLLDGLVTA